MNCYWQYTTYCAIGICPSPASIRLLHVYWSTRAYVEILKNWLRDTIEGERRHARRDRASARSLRQGSSGVTTQSVLQCHIRSVQHYRNIGGPGLQEVREKTSRLLNLFSILS